MGEGGNRLFGLAETYWCSRNALNYAERKRELFSFEFGWMRFEITHEKFTHGLFDFPAGAN